MKNVSCTTWIHLQMGSWSRVMCIPWIPSTPFICKVSVDGPFVEPCKTFVFFLAVDCACDPLRVSAAYPTPCHYHWLSIVNILILNCVFDRDKCSWGIRAPKAATLSSSWVDLQQRSKFCSCWSYGTWSSLLPRAKSGGCHVDQQFFECSAQLVWATQAIPLSQLTRFCTDIQLEFLSQESPLISRGCICPLEREKLFRFSDCRKDKNTLIYLEIEDFNFPWVEMQDSSL